MVGLTRDEAMQLATKPANVVTALLARGIITHAGRHAAHKFWGLWLEWRKVTGIRSPWEMPTGRGTPPPFDQLGKEEQLEVLGQLAALTKQTDAVLRDLRALPQPALVRATVETIVIDDVLPPAFLGSLPAQDALRAGLGVLAKHFPQEPKKCDEKMENLS